MAVDAKRVHAVFLAAVQAADAVHQAAILDRECGSDPELRQRVEAMLRAHRESATLMDIRRPRPLSTPHPSPSDGTAAFDPSSELTVPSVTTPKQQPVTRARRADRGRGRGADRARLPAAFREAGITRPAGPPRGVGGSRPGRLRHRGAGFRRDAAADGGHQGACPRNWRPPRRRASAFCARPAPRPQVRHDNVVQIHAVEEQPLPYLVMEYIPGQTLQQRLDRTGPLEVADVLRIGGQIARGLAAAHEQGLIHRDIKPGNILLESGVEQNVKITDFGLARAADDASLTQSGVIAGTPMYMAPEQAQGEALDHRADLFSLGSVLYTMASGRPPFRAATTIAVLKRVAEDTPRPIREIIPEVAAVAVRHHRQAARQEPGRALPVGGRSGRAARTTPGPPATAISGCAAV